MDMELETNMADKMLCSVMDLSFALIVEFNKVCSYLNSDFAYH